MKRYLLNALLSLLLLPPAIAWAQNPNSTAPPITTQQITFPVFTVNVTPVPSASIQLVGNPGHQTYYYWFVANYPVGSAQAAGPFIANQAPDTLSVSRYVQLFPVLPAGSSSVDVLRTTTPTPPSGACNCAVATGSSSTPINDQSNSLSTYTVNTFNPAALNITLGNEVQSAGISHLILRQNGIQVADLNTGGSTGPTLQVNGVPIQNQTLANFTDGTNTHITNPSGGIILVTNTGGGGGGNFQVNSTPIISSSTINYLNSAVTNGLTLGVVNASLGNIQLTLGGTMNNSGLTNPSTTVNGQTCTLGSSCTIAAGTTNPASQFSFPYYSAAGSASSLSGVSAPTANGTYQFLYNVTGGAAVAPSAVQVGLGGRSLTGAATTDTVLYSDNVSVVTHDQAASGAVTETLPTATSLGNASFAFRYCNHSAQTDTITPTTWTIQAGSSAGSSSLSVAPGLCYLIKINPNSATSWLADGSSAGTAGGVSWSVLTNPSGNLSLSMGANTSIFSTTTAEAQMFAWKNTTAAVVGTSQGSPIPAICGRAFHGSADVEDCLTLGELPGNGNDAAITFTLGHTGSSTGTVFLVTPQLLIPLSNSASTPSIGISGKPTYGFSETTNSMVTDINGVNTFAVNVNGATLNAGYCFGWVSSTTVPTGTPDTTICRSAAKVINFGVGSDATATLQYQQSKFTPIAVGSLPSAATNTGSWMSVSDSTSVATEGQTCVGGSSNSAAAYSNGSIWKCF